MLKDEDPFLRPLLQEVKLEQLVLAQGKKLNRVNDPFQIVAVEIVKSFIQFAVKPELPPQTSRQQLIGLNLLDDLVNQFFVQCGVLFGNIIQFALLCTSLSSPLMDFLFLKVQNCKELSKDKVNVMFNQVCLESWH